LRQVAEAPYGAAGISGGAVSYIPARALVPAPDPSPTTGPESGRHAVGDVFFARFVKPRTQT